MSDLFVSSLVDNLTADDKIVVRNILVIEEFDVFDYSFFLEFYWNALFEVVQDFLGVFTSASP